MSIEHHPTIPGSESQRACCDECAKEGRSGPQPLTLNLRPSRKNVRKYQATAWSSQRLYRPFVRWSLAIGILLGFATGAGMLLVRGIGVSPGIWWLTHAQGHGVAQIFGFAGLFTMGVAFHAIPRFRNGTMPFPWRQRIVLSSMVAGVVLRFVGQSISDAPSVSGPMLVISGVLMLAGILGFTAVAGRALAGGSARRGAVERWLAMGIAWLVAAGSIQLAISVKMAAGGGVIAYGPWNNAVIYAGLFGFLGCFIFGVSTRTVTGFLGLRPILGRLERIAFGLFNAGVGWSIVSNLAGFPSESTAWGMLSVSVGAVAFVLALRILEPAIGARKPMPGAYVHYSWFIRAAYAWLVVFGILYALDAVEILAETNLLPAGVSRPTIHILTLGFITSMIIGMGSRMIPLFEGSVIRGHRWLDLAWVALMLSVVLRVVFGFVRPGADQWLAASGVLGLLAICVFAWALLGTLTNSARESYRRTAAELGRVRWRSAISLAPEAESHAPIGT